MCRQGVVTAHDDMPSFYPATVMDGYFVVGGIMRIPEQPGTGALMMGGGTLDLPFSVVSDTILLPYDTWRYCRRKDKKGATNKPTTGLENEPTNGTTHAGDDSSSSHGGSENHGR